MGIKDRLRRLEGDGPELCEERTCTRMVHTELIRYPGGTEVRLGEEPPELCASCPYLAGRGPIRRIEIVRPY